MKNNLTSGKVVEQRGDKTLWMVPTPEYYKETKHRWDTIPMYAAMSPEEFAKEKMEDAIRPCMTCHMKGLFEKFETEPHPEYVLLELDSIEEPTGEIDTHVCEYDLKLSKKSYKNKVMNEK